nr:unnamed protein product [Callosobruchus chinensis]
MFLLFQHCMMVRWKLVAKNEMARIRSNHRLFWTTIKGSKELIYPEEQKFKRNFIQNLLFSVTDGQNTGCMG